MSGAVAITILAMFAHDVACHRIQISELGAIKFNSTGDHSKDFMLNKPPGPNKGLAGVYGKVGDPNVTATVEQPGAMGGPNNVSTYPSSQPGWRFNSTVDGDKVTAYQAVVKVQDQKFYRSEGLVWGSDGSKWKKEELASPDGAGTQNSWAGVYHEVDGSGRTVTIEQPDAMGRPNGVSILPSDLPGVRMDATIHDYIMTPYQTVTKLTPPVSATYSSDKPYKDVNGDLWEKDEAIAHKAKVWRHDGHDGNIWAGVYGKVGDPSLTVTVEQPGALGGPNNVSSYPSWEPTYRFNGTVDGDTVTAYQMVVKEQDQTFTLSKGMLEGSDGSKWKKEELASPDGAGTQNSWAGVYRSVDGFGRTVTIEQPDAMGRPNDVSMRLSDLPGVRMDATIHGNTMTPYQKVTKLTPPVSYTYSSNGTVKDLLGDTWKKDEQHSHKAKVWRH